MNLKVPTIEQQKIIDCNGNVVVTAKPGSGKTYTIVEKIARIIPSLESYQGIIAISYTNKASAELKQRCKSRGIDSKQSFFGTIDKFYIGQIIIPFASHLTGNIPDYRVVSKIENHPKYKRLANVKFPFSDDIVDIMIDALGEGIIPINLIGEIALFLLENVKGVIEYIRSRYRYVFIDEYQDCGQIQHSIFTLMVANGIIGVAVGDVDQAIFGFANRFPKYLLSLIPRKDFNNFSLSKNHRCHESISEYSLALFNSSKIVLDDKRVFLVNVIGNEKSIANRIDEYLDKIKQKYEVKDNNKVAILCRGNATATLLANYLETPNKLFKECKLDNDNTEYGRLFRELIMSYFDDSTYSIDFVEQYFSNEYDYNLYSKALILCQRIFSSKKEDLIFHENDFIELAKLIHPNKYNDFSVDLLHQTISNTEELDEYSPARDNQINIMTLHKSKGLEFEIVFHMDMYKYIIPNEYGNEEQKQQDLNLHYVGITRARKVCYIMCGSERYRNKQKDYFPTVRSPFLDIQGLKERRKEVKW